MPDDGAVGEDTSVLGVMYRELLAALVLQQGLEGATLRLSASVLKRAAKARIEVGRTEGGSRVVVVRVPNDYP
mgnify:CR=1 FL=1